MQNKTNFKYAKINVTSFLTSKYVHIGHLVIQTNKANSNPIAAIFGCSEACDKIPEFEHFPIYFSGLKMYNIK